MAVEFPGLSVCILGGGKGTRLRSVISDRPKILAPVCGKPYIAHLLAALASAGFHSCVLATGYMAEAVETTLGTCCEGISLRYSVEREARGTGGGLRQALRFFGDRVLVLNGDSFCGIDFGGFVAAHEERGAEITLASTEVDEGERYGALEIDSAGRIIAFQEKGRVTGRCRINAGIYLIERRVIEEIPEGACVSLEREVFPRAAARGRMAYYRAEGPFIDIGTPESYAQAEQFFKNRKIV